MAHLRIASSALEDDREVAGPKRLLLLLATQNADKAPKPAAFEHRLVMMSKMAETLYESVQSRGFLKDELAIDIAITKLPRFIDKSAALVHDGIYQADESAKTSPIEQVHLIGYDTLIRLLDPKYYPPTNTLSPLNDLFENHSLRVTYRTDDKWEGKKEQDDYLGTLERGSREDVGGLREWAQKIKLVQGRREGEEIISSTRVREAIERNDATTLKDLCPESVADYILSQHPYSDQA